MGSLWSFGGLGWRRVLRNLWRAFWKDRVLDEAAVLSFYCLLAVFPFLLFLVALLGLMLHSAHTVHLALHRYLTQIAPASASDLIDSTLRQISLGSHKSTVWLSLSFSLWMAASGMVAIIEALNIAYRVKESRPWWRQRLLALGLTLGLVVCLAVALVLLGFGNNLAQLVAGKLVTRSAWVANGWKVAQWLLLLGFVLMAFNVLYIFAPNVRHRRWHWLMPGTVLGVAVWLAISYGFKLYLTFFNTYNFTYGSIGGVIILLMWFYLSGIAILLGGELNSEIEKRAGKVRSAPSSQQP